MNQSLTNLPKEILSLPHFVKSGNHDNPKAPFEGWQRPENQKLYSELNGTIGVVASTEYDDSLIFFDFDHVLDDNGNFINDDAEKWFNYLQAQEYFAELSQSGTGIHMFAAPSIGKFPKGRRELNFGGDVKIEIFYGTNKFCLVTGKPFRCEPNAPIAQGVVADEMFQAILDEIKRRQPATDTSQKKSANNSPMNAHDSPEYDSFRANIMLDTINPADLSDSDWLAVISACKNIGIDYPTVDAWNKRDPDRYNEKENQTRWDSLDDPSFTIETLHGIAKRFAYDEKSVWHEFHDKFNVNNSNSKPPDAIKQWQIDNGEIEPNILTKLLSEAERIKTVTDFAAAAIDTSTQKALGAFLYYSCFAHIYDKFFADLKLKKKEVAQKIKDYEFLKRNEDLQVSFNADIAKQRISKFTPSDRELALINVDITATKNIINTYKTAAKKEHMNYLNKKKIEELNAQYQAARDAYDRDPPTTQQTAPDCPIDLILPLGVYFDHDKGIRIVDYDKPPSNRGRPVIEACQNLAVPLRAFREVTRRGENPKSKDQYEIAIKTSKHWRRAIVDARTLQDPRKILELTDLGLHIVDARMAAKYFAKILAINERNERLKVTKTYLQPGWQDKDFKFFAYPTGGDDYIVKNADFDYKGIFSPQGDKDAWLHMLRRVLFHDPNHYSDKSVTIERNDGSKISFSKDNNPDNFSDKPNLVAAMILGSSFGAPLVAPLGIRNPQMVLGFDSGNGKTAAAKFAVSFFGDPFELCPTCNATENFLEDLAVKINDFPHGVDELQAAKRHVRENMDELVYKFSGGTTRGRADIHGNAKPTFHYRGFRLFTGEQTIINNSSGQGAVSRIFEIRKPVLFADPFAIEIHNFTQNNFGHFGKDFTTHFIPNNIERIRQRFNYFRDVFSSDSFQLLSSHSTFLAYAFTGLQFGLEALGFSEDEIIKIIFNLLEQSDCLIDDAPDKLSAKNINRALPDLLNFVDSHPKIFMREAEHVSDIPSSDSLIPAEGNETVGIKLLDGRIAFNPLSLRRILSDELNYPSARQIINGFADAGFFDSENAKGKKHMKRLPSWINDIRGKTSWYYILKAPDDLPSAISA